MKGWKVEGQKEQGEQGTEHYQLMLKTPQVRGSAIKKQFPRAHIEVARNVSALTAYVHKEETRVEELKNDHKYPSPTKLMGLFQKYVDEEFGAIIKKYGRCYYEMSGEQLLRVFDDCIRSLIIDGYYVEAYGVNPQIRSSIKNYGQAVILREKNNLLKQNACINETSQESTPDTSENHSVEGSQDGGRFSDEEV